MADRVGSLRCREDAAYAVAGLSYIAAGVAWQPLLNWVIGPMWVVLVVWLVAGREQ